MNDMLFTENLAYLSPCEEFFKFRRLLDKAKIPWHDASDLNAYFTMHRTHGDGFSVVYGRASYGREEGLLEAMIDGIEDVTGYLTAEEAFALVKEHCVRSNEK